ncbi:syntaxin-2 [Phycodurus eques]|uniref:syntaxin-2 n=1 Tax=Phycodurus eques TaxID=693459 RepID=UPI002ACE5E23|nr:syntaxin-2 [Phycodurus eques]
MKDRLVELTARRTWAEEDQVAASAERESLMEGFFRRAEEVRGLLDRIRSQVRDVKETHSAILPVSSSHPTSETKARLNALTDDIEGNADVARTKLKSSERNMPRDDAANRSSVDLGIQKTQHSVLSGKFAEVMTRYNEAQVSFRERSKGRIQRQLEITGRVTTNEELEDMLESGIPSIFTSDGTRNLAGHNVSCNCSVEQDSNGKL